MEGPAQELGLMTWVGEVFPEVYIKSDANWRAWERERQEKRLDEAEWWGVGDFRIGWLRMLEASQVGYKHNPSSRLPPSMEPNATEKELAQMVADARDLPRVSSYGRDEDVWQWSRETGMRCPDLEMLEKMRARCGPAQGVATK
jgi:hypothetical protein